MKKTSIGFQPLHTYPGTGRCTCTHTKNVPQKRPSEKEVTFGGHLSVAEPLHKVLSIMQSPRTHERSAKWKQVAGLEPRSPVLGPVLSPGGMLPFTHGVTHIMRWNFVSITGYLWFVWRWYPVRDGEEGKSDQTWLNVMIPHWAETKSVFFFSCFPN